jgi:hypothetical protein
MSFEDLPPWGPRLIPARLPHKGFGFEPVEFIEPLTRIGNHRLQQNPDTHLSNADLVPVKSEFAWQPNGLAATIPE